MIPSIRTMPHARIFSDTADRQIYYFDPLEPAPVRGSSATRWHVIPGSLAYLVGEVSFGPANANFGEIPELGEGRRILPMPWESAPVFVWYRHEKGVQLVARGKTSGFGSSNAVFNGSAPLSALVSPVMVSAELVCTCRLEGARVSGSGQSAPLESVLGKALLCETVDWDVTLGDALAGVLNAMLDSSQLTLRIMLDTTYEEKAVTAELRQMVLLEWAHRIQMQLAPGLSLAAPSALVRTAELTAPVSFELSWAAGSIVSLRSVRVLASGPDPNTPGGIVPIL